MPDNKKYVELLWYGKYDKIELGNKLPIERPNLPFQVVETINKPRLKDLEDGLFDPSKFYPENKYPSNYPKDWKNLLIWGDNKLVMSSLIKQGWAGKINLIYIDPPFFTGADFTVRTKIGNEQIEKEPSIKNNSHQEICQRLVHIQNWAVHTNNSNVNEVSSDLIDGESKNGYPLRR